MTTLIKKILLLPATCLIPFLTGCNNCPSTTIVEDIIDPAIYTSLPFKMDKVEQPTFPDYSVCKRTFCSQHRRKNSKWIVAV